MTPAPPRPRLNVPIAGLSLVISLLLWSVVFSQNSKPMVTRAYTIALEADGLKEGLAVTRLPDTVSVAVTASEERFARLRPDGFVALVDLSKAEPGRRTYPVQVFPPELREVMTPSVLNARVDVEPIASRSLAVEIETKGELRDATLQVRDLTPDPIQARVTGPRTELSRVARIRGFLDLGSTTISSGGTAEVALEALDARGRALDRVRTEPLFARVRLAVASVPEEKAVFVVPTFRGAPAEGYTAASYSLVPNGITVRGSSGALAGFTKVSTEPVDLTGSSADGEFTVGVRLPPGVGAVGPSKVRVRVRIVPATPGVRPAAPAQDSRPLPDVDSPQ